MFRVDSQAETMNEQICSRFGLHSVAAVNVFPVLGAVWHFKDCVNICNPSWKRKRIMLLKALGVWI